MRRLRNWGRQLQIFTVKRSLERVRKALPATVGPQLGLVPSGRLALLERQGRLNLPPLHSPQDYLRPFSTRTGLCRGLIMSCSFCCKINTFASSSTPSRHCGRVQRQSLWTQSLVTRKCPQLYDIIMRTVALKMHLQIPFSREQWALRSKEEFLNYLWFPIIVAFSQTMQRKSQEQKANRTHVILRSQYQSFTGFFHIEL